jgi:hypothetical protein
MNLSVQDSGSAFAFSPRKGGCEELSGVFAGRSRLASSSTMRAFNAFTSASNSSMRSIDEALKPPLLLALAVAPELPLRDSRATRRLRHR